MESPSEDQKNRQETPRIEEMMHKTKTIQFFGRTTPIILQNDNGPCPLLAICNILLLRNNLSLSSDIAEVSQEKLLSLVAERLIDSNSNIDNKDAGYVKNQQQNIADAIDLLPCLATGIDVNLKFMGINDFEFTRECAIFDLLDIPLYHGWIVDPQDFDTSNAIGSKSYNTLMGELVALETQNMESVVRKNTEEDVDFCASTSTAEVPSQSLYPDPVTDKQIERGEVAEEREPLRAFELSKNVGPTSANDVNVVGTAGAKVHDPCQQEPSTSNISSLVNNYDDDLITFEKVPKQDACPSLEADNESLNGRMNTSVSNKHESKNGIEKKSIEVLAKIEDISLSTYGSDSSPSVNEFENINIGEEKSYEARPSEPNVVLESSKYISQTIDESKSLVSSSVGNEPICVLKTSTTTNEACAAATRPKDGTTSRQGELITNFLNNSASQLTIYGLFSLQDGLKERELCVFFRNNHFNTMFKFEGELYILATDQGYISQPDLVWEKLNEVNGDTVFMTSNFKKFKAESHDTGLWDEQNAMANTGDYLARTDNTAQGNTSFNSDLQLAMALQQQEYEQQQQPHRVLPQSPTTSRSGLVVGPRHVHPSRPRNSSASSRQEPKPSKEKCTVM